MKEILDEFNKDYPGVSTGIVKNKGIRSDISTLHNLGNLRVGYSLGEKEGNIKKPLNNQKSGISNRHIWFVKMAEKYGK